MSQQSALVLCLEKCGESSPTSTTCATCKAEAQCRKDWPVTSPPADSCGRKASTRASVVGCNTAAACNATSLLACRRAPICFLLIISPSPGLVGRHSPGAAPKKPRRCGPSNWCGQRAPNRRRERKQVRSTWAGLRRMNACAATSSQCSNVCWNAAFSYV